MTDEVHPLVTLLAARAKSHPEEFTNSSFASDALGSDNRWWLALDAVMHSGTDADKALLASTIGRIRMNKAHEWAMNELCNGEDRRRKDQLVIKSIGR
jgi:hypothetical protein